MKIVMINAWSIGSTGRIMLGCAKAAREKGNEVYVFSKAWIGQNYDSIPNHHVILWKKDIYIKALFPSRETLAIRYPCVRKHAALIPFVWLHRLVFRGSQALKNGALTSYIVTDEKRVAASGQKRVQMFEKLGMLD